MDTHDAEILTYDLVSDSRRQGLASLRQWVQRGRRPHDRDAKGRSHPEAQRVGRRDSRTDAIAEIDQGDVSLDRRDETGA
jgi:hypothetical protein